MKKHSLDGQKKQFSREYHVVCNGTTNRPGEKGLVCTDSKKKFETFAVGTYSLKTRETWSSNVVVLLKTATKCTEI